ncbi:MAG: DUF1987 domain-containing protein [Bacteroidales bacterium]|nr:DUF1987 domain-containing protein [Bacteroidales bacterium]
MSRLELKATTNTPYVFLDAEKGIIELSGKSYPENPIEYYTNIFNWMKDNLNKPSQKIEVSLKLEYFNTSTSKCLLDFLHLLKKIAKVNKHEITIYWFYWDWDDDMMEAGQAYENITKLPFMMIERE